MGEKKARPRLTKGQKSKNKKRVTVGVISSLNKQADGSWEGPFGKYIARFGDAEQVFKRLRQALDRMDPGVKQVVFYSDGDPQYARLARKYFPTATIVVDFYHVSEYLWKAGERTRLTWERFGRLLATFPLPEPRIKVALWGQAP